MYWKGAYWYSGTVSIRIILDRKHFKDISGCKLTYKGRIK